MNIQNFQSRTPRQIRRRPRVSVDPLRSSGMIGLTRYTCAPALIPHSFVARRLRLRRTISACPGRTLEWRGTALG
jgi:hypothetical protein